MNHALVQTVMYWQRKGTYEEVGKPIVRIIAAFFIFDHVRLRLTADLRSSNRPVAP